MNFLRALFWIVLTFVVVVFSFNNWTVVTVNLFSGLAVDAKLPVLLLAAFLIGFGPMLVWHKATRWRLRRQVIEAERLRDAAVVVAPPPVESVPPAFEGGAL